MNATIEDGGHRAWDQVVIQSFKKANSETCMKRDKKGDVLGGILL